MAGPPSSASLSRAPALAWLMSHAYAPNRVLAALAYPLAAAVTLVYVLRRGVYESRDRDGMVIVARWQPTLDAVLTITVVLLGYLGLGLLAWPLTHLEPLLGPALFVLAGASVLTGGLVLGRGQQTASPIAKDTPRTGDRWQVAALAQRPGTRLSAMLLTRRVIADVVPPGSVLVVSAGSDRLEQAYVRAGFTPLSRRRLYRIT